MSGIDINGFLNSFNKNFRQLPFNNAKTAFTANAQITASSAPEIKQAIVSEGKSVLPQSPATVSGNLQLNALQSIDRAIYAKEVMGMPKNINEFIYMVQKGLTQAQFNQMFAYNNMQRSSLSQLQAQILAQIQGLNTSVTKEMINVQLASQLQPELKKLEILSGGMINLGDISLMFQQNGKDAITKLIMSMTSASKSGISDLSQMKDMAKLINASISVAAENSPPKTLKLLLMLYLPWLPLEDGVGFDLEIQNKNDNTDESDSILSVTISTINFGIVKATMFLESSNSVQTTIVADESFPKDELLLRINNNQKFYAMSSVVNFEQHKQTNQTSAKSQNADINSSKTTQINPYLLLMAHTIIKHTIEIDNNKTLGISSHSDKF